MLAAWSSHTDRSRRGAAIIRIVIATLGWKHSEAAAYLGVNEKSLSRQLAGLEPLNHWRLEDLPDEFHQAYDAIKVRNRGGTVLEADDLAILRAALKLGKKRMARMFPAVVHDEERIA